MLYAKQFKFFFFVSFSHSSPSKLHLWKSRPAAQRHAARHYFQHRGQDPLQLQPGLCAGGPHRALLPGHFLRHRCLGLPPAVLPRWVWGLHMGKVGLNLLKRDSRKGYQASLSGLTDILAFSSRLVAQFYFSWMRRSRDPRGDTCRRVKAVLCKTAGSRGSMVAVAWGTGISKCSPPWYSENMLTVRGQILTRCEPPLTS